MILQNFSILIINSFIGKECNSVKPSSPITNQNKRTTSSGKIHINVKPKRVKLGIDKTNIMNGQTKSKIDLK